MVRRVWGVYCSRRAGRLGFRPWAVGPVLLFIGVAGIGGCGPNDGRQAVTGSVTVDSKPLDGAAISFQAAPGTEGPSSGGSVQKGHFRVPAAKGLLPGAYRVTIIAMKKTGKMINDPQKGRVPELVQVTFREPPKDVSIVAGGTNEFQFDLTSAR